MRLRRDAKTGHLERSATRRQVDFRRHRRMDLRQSIQPWSQFHRLGKQFWRNRCALTCGVNVAIKLFILQWVGSLSCSGLCQECTKQKLHRVWRLRHNLINHISEFILCQQFFDLYVAFTCSPDAALGIIIRNDSERAPSPRCLSTHCNIAIRLPLLGVAEGCHFFGF